MKISEMRELNAEELVQRLDGLKRELFDLRMDRAAGKLDKPHRLHQVRRDVARMVTILKQKEEPAQKGKG